MSNRFITAATLAVASLWLVGSGPADAARPPPPPRAAVGRFVHAPGFEVFGYYIPSHSSRVGPYQLDNMSLGAPAEFASWERGQRSATYAPVMLEFSDVRSPMATNELGQEHHTIQIRVLPDSYRVAPGFLEFRGHDRRLGQVVFSGGIDARALARAKHRNVPELVVRGGLEFSGQHDRNVSFTYFAGD